jgi:hypothetical protein
MQSLRQSDCRPAKFDDSAIRQTGWLQFDQCDRTAHTATLAQASAPFQQPNCQFANSKVTDWKHFMIAEEKTRQGKSVGV